MSIELPPLPAALKQIQHYLKTAQEHDGRDIVVSYWSRLYALQNGLKISTHQADETKLLMAIMDWLETVKKEHGDNEAITNEVAAQAHLENYALKLFQYADRQDRDANFGKNVVKAFYTSGMIYDVLQTFGELTEEATQNRKYAKWKAAYIHNCLKNGETPVPGPPTANADDGNEDAEENENEGAAGGGFGAGPSPPQESPQTPFPPPTLDVKPTPPHEIDEILKHPEKLPNPPVDEEKPGGFEPFVPQARPYQPPVYIPPETPITLSPEQSTKAQKYCKYAASALTFDDNKAAIEYLQKALNLLTTGQED